MIAIISPPLLPESIHDVNSAFKLLIFSSQKGYVTDGTKTNRKFGMENRINHLNKSLLEKGI